MSSKQFEKHKIKSSRELVLIISLMRVTLSYFSKFLGLDSMVLFLIWTGGECSKFEFENIENRICARSVRLVGEQNEFFSPYTCFNLNAIVDT